MLNAKVNNRKIELELNGMKTEIMAELTTLNLEVVDKIAEDNHDRKALLSAMMVTMIQFAK